MSDKTKMPEMQTVDEYHKRRIALEGLPDTVDTQILSAQWQSVEMWAAALAGYPILAETFDALSGTTGPNSEQVGYERQGDVYVRLPGHDGKGVRA